MNRHWTPIALATILVLTAGGPALASLCEFAEVVLFATNSIDMKDEAKALSGSVVVNDASSGPTLAGDVELNLRKKAQVGDISADSIAIAGEVVVSGQALCNELSDSTGAVTCDPLPLPVFADPPVFQQPDVRPDAEDVTVGIGETVELAAGDYGDIVVGETGTVVFTGGSYDVRSITAANKAEMTNLLFQAASEVRIEGKLKCGKTSTIGPDAGSGIGAADIVFYVGGINGSGGGIGEKPAAVDIGDSSTVDANFYVPNGRIQLRKSVVATGAFLARDIHVDKKVQLSLASAFVNQAPTAVAQEVLSDGANDLVITLEGSDPEGEDLTFSIEVDPAEGTLGAISPITPAPVDQCSQSGAACSVDWDCPGFAEGETCDTVQPPITQATVTYTPNLNNNCVTEPESGEVTCPEDFFTFGVTDDCGALGTAIVSVNGGTDETVLDPGICSVSGAECFVDEDCEGFPTETCLLDGVAAVTANDLQVDVTVDEVRTISLSGGAEGVATVKFRIESLPAGTLTDSDGTEVAAIDLPYDLPSPVLTYGAPATAQQTSFSYSVRDSATTGSPCGPPSCDTATVNIDVAAAPMLAGDDQTFELDLNTTTVFNLDGNSGGAGTPMPPPGTAGALQLTSGNGPPMTADQLSRLGTVTARGGANELAPTALQPTALAVDQGWVQFGWCDVATSPTCSGTLLDLVNEAPATEGPFTFTTTVDSCLKITDTLAKGDHWRVEEHTDAPTTIDLIGFTREVPQSETGTQPGTPAGADAAFPDPEYSSGEFELVADDYTIQLITIPPDSFSWGTAGFLRVDSGRCDQMLWTITVLPAAGTVTTLGGGLVTVGQTFFEAPTLVYSSVGAVANTSYSLEYEVTQAGLVDNSEIFFGVLTDGCALVGRPVGCGPQSGSPQASQAQSGVSDADDADASTGDGDRIPNLRVAVVGDGAGTVSSSRRETPKGSFVGLSCDGKCGLEFADGAEVVLYARPLGDDSEFIRWSGDCSGSEPITTIRVSGKRQCTAEFGKIQGQ